VNRRFLVAAVAVVLVLVLGTVAFILLTRAPANGSPSGSAGAAVIVAAGDIADCGGNGDEETAALLTKIGGTVITLGDNAYEQGSQHDYDSCYGPSWGSQKIRTKPAPGNHEYEADSAPYFAYFGAAAGPSGKGYYAYDLGGWRIYSLNSNCTSIGGCKVGSPEYEWLIADMKANPRDCVAAYWHHPRFSSGSHGNYARMQPIWKALYDAGADLVLVGHDHDYERFAPMDPAGKVDAAHGIREFVVGTGGKSHYPFGKSALVSSQVRNDNTFGVLKLTLNADAYHWQFVPVAGATFTDSGTTPCHAPPRDVSLESSP
jgi:calcineurin-like phosphoesterase family protein